MDHPELVFRLRAVPAAVFVDLLRGAAEPLNARALKRRLEDAGIAKEDVDAAWRRAQPGVKRHGNVAYAQGAYRWSDTPVPVPVPVVTPVQAFERILAGRLAATVKADLADLVTTALRERDALEERLRGAYQGSDAARAARERQIRIDSARALAEVVMEVEELSAAGAEPAVTVERIRALAKAFDLEPIGRAGDEITFDPTLHSPIGGYPPDGSPVVVIRPGYTWRGSDQDVLVGKAQVMRAEPAPR